MSVKRYPGRGCGFLLVSAVEAVEARAADGESPQARYRLSASSEYPVERMDWWTGKSFREVLDHSPGSVNMARFKSGRAAVLEEHRGAPVGVVDEADLDSAARKLNTVVRFSQTQRGQDAERDLKDRVRTNTSIGYIPKRAKLVEQNEELGDLWRVTLWEPLEVSLVGIPADPTVGEGRSAGAGETYAPVEVEDDEDGAEPKGTRNMKKWVRGENGQPVEVDASDARPAIEVRMAEVTGGDEAAKGERERVAGIHEAMQSNRGLLGGALDERVAGWVRDGASVETVMGAIMEHVRTKGVATQTDPLRDMPVKDRSRFSYARAILGAEMGKLDGVEMEVHRELEKAWPSNMARKGGPNSLLIPMRVDGRGDLMGRRTLDSKTYGKGTETVFEQPGEFIELLRPAAFVMKAGARLLTGLNGPVSFPRQTAAMSVYWMAENGGTNVTASDPTLGLATLNPKTLMGTTSYSRQFLAQSSLDVEAFVRNELAVVHGLALDRAAIHGAGANGEPVGIYQQTGVNTVDASQAILNYGRLVDMQTALATSNALQGSLAYIMNPSEAGKLKQQPLFALGQSSMTSAAVAGNFNATVWTGRYDDGDIGGYKAYATNQVSAAMTNSAGGNLPTGGSNIGCVFGNWNDLIIGMFAAMEILVDPYSSKKQALIEVVSFNMADIVMRHPESFTKAVNVA